MNTEIYAADPGAVTLAEESTAWPRVSHPVHLGGLGFGYKWNMGWMHDTLDYMSRDPIHRRYHHDRLTFGLLYAFSENFILPLSHDEVVHGKRSILGRMPGDRWQRFANLRAYYAFMWCHPGKKLIFMGGEFGQEQEWAHEHSLDWHLIADPMHRSVQDLVRELKRLYRSTPALHRLDSSPDGFSWVDANDADNSVLSFLRFAPSSPPVLVVCNFTPVVREGYRVGVPVGGYWRERINTDAACFGGSNVGNAGGLVAEGTSCHNRPFSLRLTLPPLATLIFEHVAG
jgi:1,4-alpha-glucan branching enzyme